MKQNEAMTWGRKAAARFAKSPEEVRSEILKSLQGKLSVEFQAYAKWERVSPPDSSAAASKTTKKFKKPTQVKTLDTKPLKSCSSLCQHPWNRIKSPEPAPSESEQTEKVTLLQAQIKAKEKSVKAFENLMLSMEEKNREIPQQIVKNEKVMYSTVTRDLERSMAYSFASRLSKKEHTEYLEVVVEELQSIRTSTTNELLELQCDVADVEDTLNDLQADIQSLYTYKDKTYPVKLLIINKLIADLRNMELAHKNEETELMRIINGEMDKLTEKRRLVASSIVDRIAAKTFNTSSPEALLSVSGNNEALISEIEKQKKVRSMHTSLF